ncbi:GrpB family protein [Staphylococcus simiae]|uniref:GrpB family protein n=1 Tax=Staphylococcus simiae TaxID=308354 RepID=UPI001A97226F|nr:GrpB family protein [Staphylococcus simiae]MBO1198776.1 GrpB family protein [Staphylococcus simiae]MBO1200723.1 GrpB family protein [Staphylococcus simiae]MBO1203236.1 GrpB family protein [Staphylococcus simiae]MBO1210593.1 GrpB family protein [Staphylococcus simiae]MBO1229059.1 GrpB family protein [Staphylococcus simiae]
MYSNIQPFITTQLNINYNQQYNLIKSTLLNLLDSPVQFTKHIGGTRHFNYATEPILDILVGVNNLHDITALDEKRLNYVGFYRLHHKYHKKVVMAKFNNLKDLKQQVRLHIVQINSPKFQAYIDIDHLLATNNDIAMEFNAKKQQILNYTTSIGQYEQQKQQYFDQLYKKVLAN